MGQLEELEGQLFDILGPESVAHVKDNSSAVQATRGKGFNKIQLSKIWVVSEELAIKFIDNSTQLCKNHANTILS